MVLWIRLWVRYGLFRLGDKSSEPIRNEGQSSTDSVLVFVFPQSVHIIDGLD